MKKYVQKKMRSFKYSSKYSNLPTFVEIPCTLSTLGSAFPCVFNHVAVYNSK